VWDIEVSISVVPSCWLVLFVLSAGITDTVSTRRSASIGCKSDLRMVLGLGMVLEELLLLVCATSQFLLIF